MFPIFTKAEISELLLCFVTSFEKQSGYSIKFMHSEKGTEFRHAFDELDRKGGYVLKTAFYTPEYNGFSKRNHGVIMSLARTCLEESGLPASYWNHEVCHVTDCPNFVPQSNMKNFPYTEVYCNVPRGLRNLRSFGCRIFYRPTMKAVSTLAPRTEERI